jgi:sugar phosphate isomerase/epimerase
MKSHTTLFLALGLAFAGSISFSGIAEAAKGPGIGRSFKGPVGLQLYSLRDQFKTNVAGTFNLVQSWGVRYVELAGTYGMSPEEFTGTLDRLGMKAIASHYPYEKYRDDVESIAKEAKALGLKYAGCAWIPHQGDFNEKTCREAIDVFNKAGAALAKHGIRFFYHIHGYEFQKFQDGTLMDLLIQGTDPKCVTFEMDVFWVVFPNQNPVELFKKYGKRWELVHLKDMRKGTERGSLSGGTDVRNDVALGAGLMDMPAILRAAKKAGVKWYFIEDESPTSVEQIPQSLHYLENVKF